MSRTGPDPGQPSRSVGEVWSGGQRGADQGGILGARAAGVVTRGWAPKGWRTEDGPAPWLAEHGLREHGSPSYAGRTLANVRDTDATVILGDPTSQGSKLTLTICRRRKKPYLLIRWTTERGPVPSDAGIDAVRRWLLEHNVVRWNVAGNRETVMPGIEVATTALVRAVLER